MKHVLIFLAMTALSACRFDPGLGPNNATERDSGSDVSVSNNRPNNQNNLNNVNNQNNLNNVNDGGISDSGVADAGRDLGNVDMAPDLPTMCNGMPVDPLTDPVNCGACDNRCDARFGQCAGGNCDCPGDTIACGAMNRCTDVMLDPNNCGVCGEVCGTAEFCIAGDCVCRDGYDLCGGECVDLDSNPEHCGMCNNNCGANGCQNGSCRNSPDCGFAFTCRQPNTGPACITEESSEWHCNPSLGNPCGTQCAADQVCVDPGAFQPRTCLRYRPAIVCTECPCDECTSSEFCVVSDDIPGEIYCVEDP